MISFDIKCAHNHVFEAWFRSSADYESQRVAGQIVCPTCGNSDVGKAVMAPAVTAKGNQRPVKQRVESGEGAASISPPLAAADMERMRTLMQALADEQAKTIKDSKWVGDKFAEHARAIYYGETEQHIIHGTANPSETRAMLEEGLPVAPLLVPIAPPDKTH